MDFAKRIKCRRKELNLTLLEVANRMGVSEPTVQRWESGNIKSVRHGRIAKLAEILETTPAYLMGWEETPTQTKKGAKHDALEQRLVDDFNAMNTEGRKKLVGYADDLIVSGKYNKSDSVPKDA